MPAFTQYMGGGGWSSPAPRSARPVHHHRLRRLSGFHAIIGSATPKMIANERDIFVGYGAMLTRLRGHHGPDRLRAGSRRLLRDQRRPDAFAKLGISPVNLPQLRRGSRAGAGQWTTVSLAVGMAYISSVPFMKGMMAAGYRPAMCSRRCSS